MNNFILLFIIVIIALVLFALLLKHQIITGKAIAGGVVSKSDDYVRNILETLTKMPFPQAHPEWLINNNGKIMELDGYNEELGIAFEFQGPQHTKYDRKLDSSYDSYLQRITNDKMKREILKKRGIYLITIDCKFPRHRIREYIISRLYDVTKLKKDNVHIALKYFANKPYNYIMEQVFEPYVYH